MTTRGREAAVRGCLACSIDHHACSWAVEDDAGGWSTVYCCCGLAVDPKTTAAEYAAYAEELRGLAWSQPAGAQPAARGERLMATPDPLGPGGACPCVGRCEACDGTRQLDGRSRDQDPTPPDHGATAP